MVPSLSAARALPLQSLVGQRPHRLVHHELYERQRHLGRCEHRRLPRVVVYRGHLHDVGPDDLEPAEAVEDGQELAARPAAWLGRAGRWSPARLSEKRSFSLGSRGEREREREGVSFHPNVIPGA